MSPTDAMQTILGEFRRGRTNAEVVRAVAG
jgi:hypothetical protein